MAKLLREQRELYVGRLGVPIEVARVLVRDPGKYGSNPHVSAELFTDDADAFFDTPDMPIVVEVAGGVGHISQYTRRALEQKKHVVTANKTLLAQEGPELFAMARGQGVSIAFEASCAGGIPIVNAILFGLSANHVDALYGILNGTSNYILTAMTRRGQSYAAALDEAQEKGFAEADPTMDVSGQDAAQKLAILASLAFNTRITGDRVHCRGIDKLDLADIGFGAELGYDIKLLAIAESDGGGEGISLRTEPCFIHKDQPLAQVLGSYNAMSVYGHAVGQTMYYGRGAGALPTASAVVADIINVASGWYPHAFGALNVWPDRHGVAQIADPDDLRSRFYLRINAKDMPGVLAKITAILGKAKISISGVSQHEYGAGRFVPLVLITDVAREGDLKRALAHIALLDVISGSPVCLRIVDLPSD